MSIELPKEAYQEAIASLQRYARENMDEAPGEMGNIAAAGLLDFFLEEIAPSSTTVPWRTCRNGCRCASRNWISKSTLTSSSTGHGVYGRASRAVNTQEDRLG